MLPGIVAQTFAQSKTAQRQTIAAALKDTGLSQFLFRIKDNPDGTHTVKLRSVTRAGNGLHAATLTRRYVPALRAALPGCAVTPQAKTCWASPTGVIHNLHIAPAPPPQPEPPAVIERVRTPNGPRYYVPALRQHTLTRDAALWLADFLEVA